MLNQSFLVKVDRDRKVQSAWWHRAVVYQVYWRSFYDTNGDGFGDLRGVLLKLDYLTDLGINVLWLNPFFLSPDVDNGYDISDYYNVSPKAGTMQDFEELLRAAHMRGIKVILDMVVNHTSSEHPWFQQARSAKDNPFRDYYIWKVQKNNWRSYFEPSAWTLDDLTGEYYFHSFTKHQPDLNWKNPDVRESVYKILSFWLDKGVDGFRFDAINLISKMEGFPDALTPEDISYLGNQPQVHEYLHEMFDKVLQKHDVFTVGEIPFVTPEDGLLYVAEDRQELNSLFHFQVLDEMLTWDLTRFKQIQKEWYEVLNQKGWMAQFLNNHDHTRIVTRYGNDGWLRRESATCFAAMIHTLPGIPYIYQGEETGMTGVYYDSVEQYQDIALKERYKEEVAAGMSPESALKSLQLLARDNSRTPMQWKDEMHAGFTSGVPWIPVNPNFTDINVEKDRRDPLSIFRFYQRLISLRRDHDEVVYGDFTVGKENNPELYTYMRRLGDAVWVVLLNFSTTTHHISTFLESFYDNDTDPKANWVCKINNYSYEDWDNAIPWPIKLRPYEVYILQA